MKKDFKPRRLLFIEKMLLKAKFPKLPKIELPKDEDIFIKLKRDEYDLMKKIASRQENYITQIKKQNEEINNLRDEIKDKENKRRKNASKVGAMQKHINRQELKIKALNEMMQAKEMQLNVLKKQNEMLQNKGKRKKDIESYKNYFQLRRELEKREKDE